MIRSQGGTLGTAGGDIEISAGTGAGTGGDGGNVYINGGAGPDLSGNIELKPGAGANAGKVLIGINGTSFFRMGGCKFNVALSGTWSANQICTNVPTTGVALNCTSDHASITPAQIVTCVPSALLNIKCGVSSGTLTASNITCMWLVP